MWAQHMKRKRDKVKFCPYCEQSFDTARLLSMHMAECAEYSPDVETADVLPMVVDDDDFVLQDNLEISLSPSDSEDVNTGEALCQACQVWVCNDRLATHQRSQSHLDQQVIYDFLVWPIQSCFTHLLFTRIINTTNLKGTNTFHSLQKHPHNLFCSLLLTLRNPLLQMRVWNLT